MDEKMIYDRKGQVTVWVIVAVLIVALLVALFVFSNNSGILKLEEFNPNSFIESCARDKVNEVIGEMLPRGGFVNPKNAVTYNDINVSYLCDNVGQFKPCVNQHPMLLNEMKSEILVETLPVLEGCFGNLEIELRERGYEVSGSQMKFNVSLIPGMVRLAIKNHVSFAKLGETSSFEGLEVEVQTPLYDLANVAIEIASQEAKYCYFENVGYMALYPSVDIKKFSLSDSTKVYTIKDKSSGEEMNIAIRGCVITPGL